MNKKTVGLICEYNPFHNGHAHYVREALKLGGNAVAVMSGPFVQRGEPAVADKRTRTEIALLAGVSVVVELPAVFALSGAETFADAAVFLLDALNCVDYLFFGSESGDLSALKQTADFFAEESGDFKNALKLSLKEGNSFAAARNAAFDACLGGNARLDAPNDILGVEYIKALTRQKSPIEPIALKRSTDFLSASAIRRLLFDGDLSVKNHMPAFSYERLPQKEALQTPEIYAQSLRYAAIKSGKDGLSSIAGVNEGLENRIFNACFAETGFADIVKAVKSKRYAESTIRRVLMNVVLDAHKGAYERPLYIRILGFRRDSAEVVRQIAANAKLPVITRFADTTALNDKARDMLAKDVFASELYQIMSNNPKREFSEPIVKI